MTTRHRLLAQEIEWYFVTTTVVRFARVFTEDRYCEILIRNIKHYQERYHFEVVGYVIMPSHFHWIVELNPNLGTISDIMRDLKKYSAWDLMEALEQDRRKELADLFSVGSQSFPNQKRKFWMPRFDDQVIRDEKMMQTKLDYIHENPVKAGLCKSPEQYRYSSAMNYYLGDHSILEVKTEW
jgi:REP element-mobilizing transposase RayT